MFHSVQNAKKQSIKNATINSIEQTEVSVKYICNKGYFYTLDNPTVTCTENGFDNKIGKCVRGRIVFNILKNLVVFVFS